MNRWSFSFSFSFSFTKITLLGVSPSHSHRSSSSVRLSKVNVLWFLLLFSMCCSLHIAVNIFVYKLKAIFLCACPETPSLLLPVRNLFSQSLSARSISYKNMEILTFWQSFSWFFGNILLRMRRHSHFWASGCNSDNAVWFGDPDFL